MKYEIEFKIGISNLKLELEFKTRIQIWNKKWNMNSKLELEFEIGIQNWKWSFQLVLEIGTGIQN